MSDTDAASKQFDWRRFLIANVPYVVLYVIAIWLVALTDSNQAAASADWELFIPLVGLVSIIGGWRYAGVGGRPIWVYLLKQVLHWGVLVVVINLLFLESMLQFLNAQDHGFVVIYLLGLAAILSGIYLDWKMAVFGTFLILSAIGIGYIEDNLLVIMTASLAAVVGVLLTLVFRNRFRRRVAGG